MHAQARQRHAHPPNEISGKCTDPLPNIDTRFQKYPHTLCSPFLTSIVQCIALMSSQSCSSTEHCKFLNSQCRAFLSYRAIVAAVQNNAYFETHTVQCIRLRRVGAAAVHNTENSGTQKLQCIALLSEAAAAKVTASLHARMENCVALVMQDCENHRAPKALAHAWCSAFLA